MQKMTLAAIASTILFVLSALAICFYSKEISSSTVVSIVILATAFASLIVSPIFATAAFRGYVDRKRGK